MLVCATAVHFANLVLGARGLAPSGVLASTESTKTIQMKIWAENEAWTMPNMVRSVPRVAFCEKVPGTGEVARFPVETLGQHMMGTHTM